MPFFSHQGISQRGVWFSLVIKIFHRGTYAFYYSSTYFTEGRLPYFSHQHISQREICLLLVISLFHRGF